MSLHPRRLPRAASPRRSAAGVGVAGYTLGGGISPLSRLVGLGCDQLQSVQVVTAAGRLVTASRGEPVGTGCCCGPLQPWKGSRVPPDLPALPPASRSSPAPHSLCAVQHADLFWASCGGGGGTFGVVTRFSFRLRMPGALTAVAVQYVPGEEAMAQAYLR